MNRTQEEIVAKVALIKQYDPFGMTAGDLLEWLDFKHAKVFLVDGVTEDQWKTDPTPKDVKTQMIEYMEFAWEKANNQRGLSAMRSMAHYRNWLWLLGEDKLADSLEGYTAYGKPQLVEICNYLGLDSKRWDNGDRSNGENI